MTKKIIYHFDFFLPVILLPFIGISLFLVGELNHHLFQKEIAYIVIGFITFFIAFLFPIRKYIWLIPFLYFLNLLLLVSVDLFGISILGAKRWIKIPLFGLTIQPSEFMKTTMILMLGYLIHKNPPDKDGYNLKQLLKLSIYIIIPFLLIAKEPDLGSALILFLIGFGTLIIVGIRKKIIIFSLLFSIIFIPFAYKFILHDYQKQRISNFLGHPSYHVEQSMIAIGSGGITGVTKHQATQAQLKFLPVASSDFIFSYFTERFGLIGVILLCVWYFFLVYYLLSYTEKLKHDYFAMPIFAATAITIFIYSYVNMSMTIGLAPVVGVPLPFLSHGGTNFINFMIIFGILENLLAFKYEFIYNFNSEDDMGL
jgi:rod shape determining protein RodA